MRLNPPSSLTQQIGQSPDRRSQGLKHGGSGTSANESRSDSSSASVSGTGVARYDDSAQSGGAASRGSVLRRNSPVHLLRLLV